MREESFSLLAADFLPKSEGKKKIKGEITVEKNEDEKSFITTLFFSFPFSIKEENEIKEQIKEELLKRGSMNTQTNYTRKVLMTYKNSMAWSLT